MKTTLDIPEDVLRQSKAAAAMRGESLADFVTDSLLARLGQGTSKDPSPFGWRRAFGKAKREEVAEVDEVVSKELGGIDADSWR